MAETRFSLDPWQAELSAYPAVLAAEAKKASAAMARHLATGELENWMQEGVALTRHSPRSWEASLDYFRTSPLVVEKLAYPFLLHWMHWGNRLAQASPTLAGAFFRASQEMLGSLSPRSLGDWAQMALTLYKGDWRSTSIASRFLELSPRILHYLALPEAGDFVRFLDILGRHSPEQAMECLGVAEGVLGGLERQDRRGFLHISLVLVEHQWRDARSFFQAGAKVMSRIDRGSRERFLLLGETLARDHSATALSFIVDGSQSLDQIDRSLHASLLDWAADLLKTSPVAATELLKSCPRVLARIRGSDLQSWVDRGRDILAENREGGEAYFRLESQKGEDVLGELSKGVDLEKVREVLRMYCEALSGSPIQILPLQNLAEKGIGWLSQEKASTEGTTLYLPPYVDKYTAPRGNFDWFKVLVTHQCAHLEFGSFIFDFEREGHVFPNSRRERAQAKDGGAVDMERFFDLFSDRVLGRDIFTLVEDSRVDSVVKHEYPGICPLYRTVQQDELGRRPEQATLPLREAFLEALVLLSLDAADKAALPPDMAPVWQQVVAVARQVHHPQASVEDSAEATLRIYDLLSQIPNVRHQEEPQSESESPDESGPEGEQEEESSRMPGQGTSEVPYTSPQGVEFRGEFKPELVQLLNKLRQESRQVGSQATPDTQSMQSLIEKSAEVEKGKPGQPTQASAFIDNLLKEAGAQPLPTPGEGHGGGRNAPITPGTALSREEPLTFLYDEWDMHACDYKPRWCRVREKRMEEGSTEFFDHTLQEHATLVNQIRKEFELITPERFRRLKRLEDGEGLDMDAVVDAVVEMRAGVTPTDKVYWRRNKVERDVSVAFLLDFSASTAEAIDEGTRSPQDWDAPDDPRQYLAWFRSRRLEEGTRRGYKRIIDLEKESAAVLIRALETIGDTYGIYGFSGYGRENVEFFVVKDLKEAFSDTIKRRLDRIAPLHATRMGPAIRHAVSKLDGEEARTKILFLISDGRPQDHGYSRDGVEKEYAIHDTKTALTEAKHAGIIPFCLTVDRDGHDYLRTMCQDVAYQVVSDIRTLPRRLISLYKSLTA
ncbi:MAG: VWA domain-containing protein [Chloroflexi bacterium]|nr:VWA domain-containing protein [Chloroflexota bacterium]